MTTDYSSQGIKPPSFPVNSANVAVDIAPFIDHTLLAPAATRDHILKICDEADRYQFATVCVYPAHVSLAVEHLHNKKPGVCTVIGFPSGATTSQVKLYEAREAIENGADELDVVINLGWLKMGETNLLHKEMAEIVELTGKPVKAILETTLLTTAEKRLAAEVCLDAGVVFLKTSTGWQGGATVDDVKLLSSVAGNSVTGQKEQRVGNKATGGISPRQQAIVHSRNP